MSFNEQKQNKGNNLLIILIVAILLLLGGLVYLLIGNKNKSEQISSLTSTMDSTNVEVKAKAKELESLKEDMIKMMEERNSFGLSNDSLNAQIDQLNEYIVQVKKTVKLGVAQKQQLNEMISKLRQDLVKKDLEIVGLKTKNDSLFKTSTNLENEKSKLGDSLINVSIRKKDLNDKLKYASILKAQKFRITVLKSSGKELEDDEYKASRIDRVKVTFSLADNKAANRDVKDFQLRLITPTGETFSDNNNGGGTLQTGDGKELKYTMKQSIPFNNTEQDLTYITLSGLSYISGIYVVEIYCEGYKIGQSQFKVR